MKYPQLFIFITSLNKLAHEEDNVYSILPFVDDVFKKEHKSAYEMLIEDFPKQYIQAYYHKFEDENVGIIKINGASIMDNSAFKKGTKNESLSNNQQLIKDLFISPPPDENDVTNNWSTLAQKLASGMFASLADDHIYKTSIYIYIHAGHIKTPSSIITSGKDTITVNQYSCSREDNNQVANDIWEQQIKKALFFHSAESSKSFYHLFELSKRKIEKRTSLQNKFNDYENNQFESNGTASNNSKDLMNEIPETLDDINLTLFEADRHKKFAKSVGRKKYQKIENFGSQLKVLPARLFTHSGELCLRPLKIDLYEDGFSSFFTEIILKTEINQAGQKTPLVKAKNITSCHCIIAFAKMKDFSKHKLYQTLELGFAVGEELAYRPVIVIGLMNIMAYYNKNDFKLTGEEKSFSEKAKKVYERLDLDKRFRFFDSSIWFQYIDLAGSFKDSFGRALKTVTDNLSNNIYNTVHAVEYLEYNLRRLKSSYIAPVWDAPHPTYITPFIAHPESRLFHLAERHKALVQGYRWKLLLIDDYAERGLPLIDDEYQEYSGPTKLKLLNILLKELAPNENQANSQSNKNKSTPDNTQEQFTVRSSISEKGEITENILKDEKNGVTNFIPCNLALINYYFEYDNNANILDNSYTAQYGFELIKSLYDHYKKIEIDRDQVPHWVFMTYSTFNESFISKLRDTGVPLSSNGIDVLQGADSICTPQLFRYRLYHELQRQLEQVAIFPKETDFLVFDEKDDSKTTPRIRKDEYKKLSKEVRGKLKNKPAKLTFSNPAFFEQYQKWFKPKPRLLYIFEKLFDKENAKAKNKDKNSRVREYAAKQYSAFIKLYETYNTYHLMKPKPAFAKDIHRRFFFEFDQITMETFRELLHQMTHSEYHQHAAMWENYIYLHNVLKRKTQILPEELLQEHLQKFDEILDKIGIHISSLGKL